MHIPGLFLTASLWLSASATAQPEVTEPSPAAQARPLTDTPAKPKPKFTGIGLAAGAGVLSGASLGVTVARSVLLKKNCQLDSSMPSAGCTYDFGSDIGLAAGQWTLNFGVVGMAPAAGIVMGRHHAWKDEQEGRQARNVRALRIAGGSLIGVGVAGVGTSIALAFVLPARCLDKELDGTDPLAGDRCLMKSFPAWTVTNWASFQMIGAGAGMMGYGNAYRRHRPKAVSQIKVAPYAGPTYAGVGIAGKF